MPDSTIARPYGGSNSVAQSIGSPTVYVVAGPNGAGKTTFSSEFLPKIAHCDEFLNADLIAAGLSPFAPETQDLRAAELMLIRIDECILTRRSFGFETTLAARSYVARLLAAKEAGYRVATFFLWLPDVRMAIARVAQRVAAGGHFVPEATIRTRYEKGLVNFRDLYRPISDSWFFYDASSLPLALIANGTATSNEFVADYLPSSASRWIATRE
jgi:predicted ABC-type ATPase